LKIGVTIWPKTDPIEIPFEITLRPTHRLRINDPNRPKSKHKIPVSREILMKLVRECIEVKKLSFTDTVIKLGVSPTTVRRVCRTLKIGRYREQSESDRLSNSSQVPFGWKSVHGFLEKDPIEWRCVEMMKKFREEGKSFHWIAKEMTRLGVKTKNSGRWHAKTVIQILSRL
jgi:hypothetical protein